jgi:hypothetical protein
VALRRECRDESVGTHRQRGDLAQYEVGLVAVVDGHEADHPPALHYLAASVEQAPPIACCLDVNGRSRRLVHGCHDE